ncbi:hypothetical protein [Spiractinospora alimapuensis]|uniref:hypothetical protein n=1 Tax=Spiractinospora alimapuensis TaxID=2820884 RepID=UPI001F275ECF|nr:hypothetical protein [Spiractinospora alimapuensis]
MNKLPPATRNRLALRSGERVLAHGPTGDDVVVATTWALHVPGPDGYLRVAWEHVDQASWTEDGLRFTDDTGADHTVAMDHPGRLPEVVQERVTATIAASRHVALPAGEGTLGVRLSARRPPGAGSESVTWRMRFDSGLDPHDAETRTQAERALTRLREQTGL